MFLTCSTAFDAAFPLRSIFGLLTATAEWQSSHSTTVRHLREMNPGTPASQHPGRRGLGPSEGSVDSQLRRSRSSLPRIHPTTGSTLFAGVPNTRHTREALPRPWTRVAGPFRHLDIAAANHAAPRYVPRSDERSGS